MNRKQKILAGIGIALTGAACCACLYLSYLYLPRPAEVESTGIPTIEKPTKLPTELPTAIPDDISIASFNIQVFGRSKSSKEDVMQVLSDIVDDYEITAIQEIRDKSQETMPTFMTYLPEEYDFVISERLGRTQSKEQYAFVFNTTEVYTIANPYVYTDTKDVFEREPFISCFESGSFDFCLVNIHTKPDDAKTEIQALEDVVIDIKEKDVIVLGDFNADGDYFSESTTTGFRDNEYFWAIPDEVDTNVAQSDRTYDRIVFVRDFTLEDYVESGVFRFDQEYSLTKDFTKDVSDHYPVYAVFFTYKDTD